MKIRDNGNYIKVFLGSYYTTSTGRGVSYSGFVDVPGLLGV